MECGPCMHGTETGRAARIMSITYAITTRNKPEMLCHYYLETKIINSKRKSVWFEINSTSAQ